MVPNRPRVSAAVFSADGRDVLMVKHRRRDGTEYWQFPGGGILANESPEAAALRELQEETGLAGRIVRLLFSLSYKYGTSTTFLVRVDPAAPVTLGSDPEDAHADHRKLVEVAWLPIVGDVDSPEIQRPRLLL